MKRLFNVSPFILLLVPVFIMTLFTFTILPVNKDNDTKNEAALKTSKSASLSNVFIYLKK